MKQHTEEVDPNSSYLLNNIEPKNCISSGTEKNLNDLKAYYKTLKSFININPYHLLKVLTGLSLISSSNILHSVININKCTFISCFANWKPFTNPKLTDRNEAD